LAASCIHANALILGETGLLLRGPSGAGKSALTLSLVAAVRTRGDFARLVADDRVSLEACNGRLIARPHPRIAGMIEARGLGPLRLPHEPACLIQAVVDLCGPDEKPARLPEAADNVVSINDIALPRLVLDWRHSASIATILLFLLEIGIF
jgi:HPr kinase/phosphorylase